MFSNLFANLLSNAIGIFRIAVVIIVNGGWILGVCALLVILKDMYKAEIGHQWAHSQEWVFLHIRPPKENETSTLAVESIFAQMHAIHTSVTFSQKWVEGKDQLWLSLELISLGGKISFIIRAPKKARDLVEAAIYSQYPTAEITEVADYMENMNYDPETSDVNIWGCEWGLIEDEMVPIKTYKDFEHPTSEDKIIDPLSSHFEALAKIQPHEFYGVQLIIQPLGDKEWKDRAQNKAKELMGEHPPHEAKFSDLLMAPINAVANFSFKDALLSSAHGEGHEEEKGPPKWQSMTDLQKERVNLVERKASKPGYKTKIRHLYIAPKNKFDGNKKSVIIGSYRPLGSAMTNSFKPDTKNTWTGLEYNVSPTLERPYIEHIEKKRKRTFFGAYKGRNIHIGNPAFIMNVEEIATLYHFPLTTKPVTSNIERAESKKAQAPANLPVAEL